MTARRRKTKLRTAPTRRPRPSGPSIDVLVQSRLWQREPRAAAAVRKAIAAAARALPARHAVNGAEVSLLLTNDKAIQTLNKQWRGKNKPTNVLSFPAADDAMLGDIVIAYETLARESSGENKRFLHHLSHLAVHGFLHLIGYDHETDSQARAMERLERAILAGLNIPDPYEGQLLRDDDR